MSTTDRNGKTPPRALVVEDEADLRRLLCDVLEDEGFDVVGAGDIAAAEQAARAPFDVAFVDINLPGGSGLDLLESLRNDQPGLDVIVCTGKATVGNAVEATRRGAFEYLTKPLDLEQAAATARQVIERQALGRQIASQPRIDTGDGGGLIGQSPAMQHVYKTIGRVAATPTTVLIQGESGTGKEVVSRAIHRFSEHSSGPFVAVNCSAIPAELLESEMFGHERGAFTGAADRRKGKIEQAAGGTLFLDEIGDMPLELQAKLLRVLQEREYSRVGGMELLPVQCRVLAATNMELEKAVQDGTFREDLYFRLKVVLVNLPPLRERRQDIPALVEFFIERINEQSGFGIRGVAPDAVAALARQDWPGNVRELENVLLRAAALAPDRVLTADDLAEHGASSQTRSGDNSSLDELIRIRVEEVASSEGAAGDLYARLLAQVERPLLEAVLEQTGGNQLKAAEVLGMNRNTLRKKIVEHGIEPKRGQGQ